MNLYKLDHSCGNLNTPSGRSEKVSMDWNRKCWWCKCTGSKQKYHKEKQRSSVRG